MIRLSHCLRGIPGIHPPAAGESCQVPREYLAYARTGRPVVFWNVTSACNLACTHCYAQAGPRAGGQGELATAEALSLVDDLAGFGVPLLILSGGEPLLRQDIWEILARARDRGLPTAISTNGTLIDEGTAGRLRDHGVGYVGISLDGAGAAVHERARGVAGSFGRAIDGLRSCSRAGIKTGIRFTATRDTAGELGPLVSLAREMGVGRFCVYWLVPSGRGSRIYGEKCLDRSDAVRLLDELYDLARDETGGMEYLTVDAPQDLIRILVRLKADDPARYESLTGGPVPGFPACSAGDRVACIDPAGGVYPCQFARLGEFFVGSARERTFGDLWTDPLNPVLRTFREKAGNLKGKCGTCVHMSLCGGGCRIRAYHALGDIHAGDPFCPLQP